MTVSGLVVVGTVALFGVALVMAYAQLQVLQS